MRLLTGFLALVLGTAQSWAAEPPAREQVIEWINADTRERITDTAAFSFETANLDEDDDLEIAARFQRTPHLGQFFVLDRRSDGSYRLADERYWNVVHWCLTEPREVGGKRMFEVIDRTGGSGLDQYIARLWYLEDGKLVTAWAGTSYEEAASPPFVSQRTIGGYGIDGENLTAWAITDSLDEKTAEPVPGTRATSVRTYSFDGTEFTFAEDEPQAVLEAFLGSRIVGDREEVHRLSGGNLRRQTPRLFERMVPRAHSYVIEAVEPIEGGMKFRVATIAGNNRSVNEIRREEFILRESGGKWLVEEMSAIHSRRSGDTYVPGSDPESLNHLVSFMSARIARNEDMIRPLMSEELQSRLEEKSFEVRLIGGVGHRIETYDIRPAEREDGSVIYSLTVYESDGNRAFVSRMERVTLQQLDGGYLVTGITP